MFRRVQHVHTKLFIAYNLKLLRAGFFFLFKNEQNFKGVRFLNSYVDILKRQWIII